MKSQKKMTIGTNLWIFAIAVWACCSVKAAPAPVAVDFSVLGSNTVDITAAINPGGYAIGAVTFMYDDLGSGVDFGTLDQFGVFGTSPGRLIVDFSAPVQVLNFDFGSLGVFGAVSNGVQINFLRNGVQVGSTVAAATNFAPYDPLDPTLGGDALGTVAYTGAAFDQAVMSFSTTGAYFDVSNIVYTVATRVAILLQQGAGGLAGVWTLGTNYQPEAWTAVTAPLGGAWALPGMNQQHILLQQGPGGLIGLWDTVANVPSYWWSVSGPLAGWVARDVDGNRILLQQGDGGAVGIWTLNTNNTPAAWTALSGPMPNLIARALAGNRVLVQFGATALSGYWTLDGGNNVTAWTPLNAALPAGWILRDMSQNYILLQAGDGGMSGLWGVDTNGVPNAWYPVAGPMPGWIMRCVEEQ